MRGISIGRRHDIRAHRSETPIYDALTRAIVDFGKAGVLPSQLRGVTLAPDAWLALYKEQKHNGEYYGEPPWFNIAGIIFYRSNQ